MKYDGYLSKLNDGSHRPFEFECLNLNKNCRLVMSQVFGIDFKSYLPIACMTNAFKVSDVERIHQSGSTVNIQQVAASIKHRLLFIITHFI